LGGGVNPAGGRLDANGDAEAAAVADAQVWLFPQVLAIAKRWVAECVACKDNQSLGFKIPYTYEGRPGNYYPDYILRVDGGA
jgi:hypothetical protein